jgi:hypothetical protein
MRDALRKGHLQAVPHLMNTCSQPTGFYEKQQAPLFH